MMRSDAPDIALLRAMNRPLPSNDAPLPGWRGALYKVVYQSDTPAGVLFDKVLIALILASVTVVVIDSVITPDSSWGTVFEIAEWGFTLLFTVEYVLRLLCVRQPLRYATSFFGIVDLIAILPTYLALLFPELHALIDVRVLRLLRVFRIFKLTAYLSEYQALGEALAASSRKILVFLSVVLMIVVVMGSVMYVVEGPANGFTSIPVGIYWAITTMTTVGFGDITPRTGLGRLISSMMMLLGWGTLAVPTGIVTSEMTLRRHRDEHRDGSPPASRRCARCDSDGHLPQAVYCHHCGVQLD